MNYLSTFLMQTILLRTAKYLEFIFMCLVQNHPSSSSSLCCHPRIQGPFLALLTGENSKTMCKRAQIHLLTLWLGFKMCIKV